MNAVTGTIDVSVEAVAGLERRMTVRMPAAEIEREIDARLAKVGRKAKLKGFRPGKAPPKVLRQHYGVQVRDEVLSEVVRSTYSRAIKQQKLNPAGGPRIEATDYDHAAHFSYRATFEVYPEIDLSPIEKLAIRRPQVAFGESDIDAMIEKLRVQRAEWRAVERPARAGDRVCVDFSGRIDGQSFAGGQGADVTIMVGGGQALPEFDAALPGAVAGETKAATVKFAADYGGTNVAGKTAEFEITVKRVEERVLPAIDSALAAAFGVQDGGIDRLRAEVRRNVERDLDERRKAELKSRVFSALIGANTVALPQALIEDEIDRLGADALRRLGTDDPKRAPPRERLRDPAARRVLIGLLVRELVTRHAIRLDRQRVDRRIEALAASYEKPDEAAQFYRGNRDMLARVEAEVFEGQVVDFVLERVKVEDEQIAYKDFMGA